MKREEKESKIPEKLREYSVLSMLSKEKFEEIYIGKEEILIISKDITLK